MRKHIALIVTGISMYAHAVAGTDSAGSTRYAQADTMAYTLNAVTVTSGTAQRVTSSTAPMRIVDNDCIIRTGVTDVSDALHRLPGVTLRDYGGAGGLKTVSVRGFGAGHTGVSYDGVPLSDVQSGQIDLSRYSVDNVSSISMIIGDNDDIFIPARLAASSATVNIATVADVRQQTLTAKLRMGSFGFVNPYLNIGLPISHNCAIDMNGEYTHADNDYPFTLVNGNLSTREKRNNSRMNSGHGELNFTYRDSTANLISAKLYYYGNSRQLPGPVIYYNNVNHERLTDQNAMAQIRSRNALPHNLRLAAIAKFNYARSRYRDENGKYPGGILQQNYTQREYYLSGSLLWTPHQYWVTDYSADYAYNCLRSNLASNSRPYRNSILQSLSVKYRSSSLTVMARMLASVYLNGAESGSAAKDHSRISPSLSVSWKPSSDHLLYLRASYKNIFRMPTFNEAYFDHYGSQDVKPESTDQVNIGVTYTTRASGILTAASCTADAYINNIRDMIVAVPYNMFIWRIVNLGKVRTYGLDITANADISPARTHTISITAAYGLQRSMPVTSPDSPDWHKQVAYIPVHSGSATLSWINPWVCACVTATGVSERYTTNENLESTRIAGYVVTDFSAWRDFSLGRHSAGIRIDILNIFDKKYCVVARYPMPGRQFRVTLHYQL